MSGRRICALIMALSDLYFVSPAQSLPRWHGWNPSISDAASDNKNIDRLLNCSAILLLISNFLEKTGYPYRNEISDMQRKSVLLLREAESLEGTQLKDRLFREV